MRKIEIWDVLFWIGMFILIGYIIGKLFGWINSPVWVDLIPVITITFLVGVSYQKILGSLDRIYNRTDYLKGKLDKHSDRLDWLEGKK